MYKPGVSLTILQLGQRGATDNICQHSCLSTARLLFLPSLCRNTMFPLVVCSGKTHTGNPFKMSLLTSAPFPLTNLTEGCMKYFGLPKDMFLLYILLKDVLNITNIGSSADFLLSHKLTLKWVDSGFCHFTFYLFLFKELYLPIA